MNRRRIVLSLAVLASSVAVAMVATACCRPGSVFTEDDNGRTVSAQIGETLQVTLTENPTTGFLWRATASDGLVITGSEYTADDQSGTLAGSGGVRTWTLELTGPGSQEFTAALQPPDAAASPVATYVLRVAAP